MARGFESKSVADQQESRQNERRPRSAPHSGDPAQIARRRKLELALCDVRSQLARARAEGHRRMLETAAADLEAELARLPGPTAADET